jgi:hypothetical protein
MTPHDMYARLITGLDCLARFFNHVDPLPALPSARFPLLARASLYDSPASFMYIRGPWRAL